MSKTIRSNSKQLLAILSSIVEVRSYTLSNAFSGQVCEAVAQYGDDRSPWGWLRASMGGERGERPRLRLNDEGRLVVSFHSNSWLEITFSVGEI